MLPRSRRCRRGEKNRGKEAYGVPPLPSTGGGGEKRTKPADSYFTRSRRRLGPEERGGYVAVVFFYLQAFREREGGEGISGISF